MLVPEWDFSWPVFWAFHFLLLPFTAAHVLLHKRLPQAGFGWLVVIFTLPLGGSVLYGLFGVNRIRRRAQKLQRSFSHEDLYEQSDVQCLRELPVPWNIMATAARNVCHLPLCGGNAVRHLHRGDAAFPAMLSAIRQATESVYLSTYIFEKKGIGADFIQALDDAAGRGVDVRVIVDGIGALFGRRGTVAELKRRGVQAELFLPPRLWPPAFYLNLRNHRKLLLVDRKVAFTGGINISEKNNPEKGQTSNDDQFAFRGPVVDQLLAIFAEDWAFVSGQSNDIELPLNQPLSGNSCCRAIPEGPDRSGDQINMLLTVACNLARSSITLVSPYFLPVDPLSGAICAAALRGVRVRVLIPRRGNYPMVDWACRHQLPQLLRYGIEVREMPPPLLHSKLFLADDSFAMVGTINVDARSLQLNFELMVEVYDTAFAQSLQQHVNAQWAQGRDVTYESLAGASLPLRLRNALAGLWAPYL